MVTMEEREAKHIFLKKKLSEYTTYQIRWVEIIRDEYVMLIWLPRHGFQQSEAASNNVAYIPERVFSDPSYCYCGLQLKASPEDAKCFFVDTLSRNLLCKL